MTRVRILLLCAWFVICLMAPANGQVTTATVKGTVTDPSGAAIPTASLKLENTSRGVSRTAVASADGRFSFDFVGVGTYQLTVSQSGFNNLVRSGLELTSGQVLELPLQLDVRQQSQSVEVSATVAAIDTSTAEQVATLNDAQVHDLPVAHLDWSNLLTDSPGITKPPFQTSLNSTRQEGSGVNINGLPSAGYNFTVDGTNNSSDMFYPAFNVYQGTALINTVNNDAIQELTTEKATAPAIVGGGMFRQHQYRHQGRHQFLSRKPARNKRSQRVRCAEPVPDGQATHHLQRLRRFHRDAHTEEQAVLFWKL